MTAARIFWYCMAASPVPIVAAAWYFNQGWIGILLIVPLALLLAG